ncbi:MAG: sigma-70 family RNA polymerase sigma factor, partial [Gemmataceae bacterium]|nr:sigma-70 family RNA polymerase sigma factor [Gemmataceae bacterium]
FLGFPARVLPTHGGLTHAPLAWRLPKSMAFTLAPISLREASRIDSQRNLTFVRLFAQHEHQVYAYIVSVLANWTDADEVMQETSVALWEMFDDFQEGTSFTSWACRIAYFRILRFRERQRRDRLEFSNEFVEAVAATALDESDSFEDRRRALGGCVERLRPDDRRLLQMCYADGGTIKHAAERLDRPAKGVYKALARIRQALFECVQRKMASEGVQ